MSDIDSTTQVVQSKPKGAMSKYSPLVCDKIVAAAAEGAHISGMMLAAGIKSKDTWYRWIKEYPDFAEAVEYAREISLAYHEKMGHDGAYGKIKNFNATAHALIMNNKFKEEYSRNGSGPTTEITVNTINLTDSEKMEKIKQKLQFLRKTGLLEDGTSIIEHDS